MVRLAPQSAINRSTVNRYPLLEQLRADRERQEAEIAAPHIHAAEIWQRSAMHARDALAALERTIGDEIGQHLVREMSAEIARHARQNLFEAMAKARGLPSETVTVRVSLDALRFGDTREVEYRVLEAYKDHCSRNLRAAVSSAPMSSMAMVQTQVLDVRVPAMGCRHVVREF